MIKSLLIFLLSFVDALFTLYALGLGGRELNPIMDYFLAMSNGNFKFLFIKMLITIIALPTAYMIEKIYPKHFDFLNKGLNYVIAIYCSVIGFHIINILIFYFT